jgi:hypothetical protein
LLAGNYSFGDAAFQRRNGDGERDGLLSQEWDASIALSGTQRLWKLKLKVKLVLFEINLIFPFETTIRLVVLFGI